MLFTLVIIFIFLFGFIIIFSGYQIYTNIFHPGAVYYPTTDNDVKRMLKLAKVDTKDILVDLGSGDGRILIEAARVGATAIGYEINPILVWKSRRWIKQEKLDHLATIHWKSFWKADFSNATVVTVYLFPHLMNRLQKLLEEKVDHPTRLVVNDYTFNNLTWTKHCKKIYLYNFKGFNS